MSLVPHAAIRLGLVVGLVALAVALQEGAVASPKKALGDYSQHCQDAHLKCLNDCQADPPVGYTSEADILACMGVCDDWLDDACDKVFPKARVKLPESVLPPAGGGVFEPDTSGPVLRVVPKLTPEGAIGQ